MENPPNRNMIDDGKAKLIPHPHTNRLVPQTSDRYVGALLASIQSLTFTWLTVEFAKAGESSYGTISQSCYYWTSFSIIVSILQVIQVFHLGVLTCRLFQNYGSLYFRVHYAIVVVLCTLNILSIGSMLAYCGHALVVTKLTTAEALISFAFAWSVVTGTLVVFCITYVIFAWVLGPPTYNRATVGKGKGSKAYHIDFLDIKDFQGECSWVQVPSAQRGGRRWRLGLAGAPGRLRGGAQDLEGDLSTIRAQCGQDAVVVTLLEEREMKEFGHPEFLETVRRYGLESIHFPMRDKWFPEDMNAYLDLLQDQLFPRLWEGKTLLIHCYGGKGRTALIASGLLVMLNKELGVLNAVKALRSSRPGMFKNWLQRYYLFTFIHSLSEPKAMSSSSSSIDQQSVAVVR